MGNHTIFVETKKNVYNKILSAKFFIKNRLKNQFNISYLHCAR